MPICEIRFFHNIIQLSELFNKDKLLCFSEPIENFMSADISHNYCKDVFCIRITLEFRISSIHFFSCIDTTAKYMLVL